MFRAEMFINVYSFSYEDIFLQWFMIPRTKHFKTPSTSSTSFNVLFIWKNMLHRVKGRYCKHAFTMVGKGCCTTPRILNT